MAKKKDSRKRTPQGNTGSNKDDILAVFDVDDLILQTPHRQAWHGAAKRWSLTGSIDENDFNDFYEKHIAGIPGMTGAERILTWTGHLYNNRIFDRREIDEESRIFRSTKQEIVDIKREAMDFSIYKEVVMKILNLSGRSVCQCVVSSSENAEKFLKAIDLNNYINGLAKGDVGQVSQRENGEHYPEGTRLYDIFEHHYLGASTHKAKTKRDLYNIALEGCEIDKETRVGIFEDSFSAIKELRENPIGGYNVRIFGIYRDEKSASGMQEANPDYMLTDGEFDDITPECLMNMIASDKKINMRKKRGTLV